MAPWFQPNVRKACAERTFDRPTAGYCQGSMQANPVVLPVRYAEDFEIFCRNSLKMCPLLEIVGPETTHTRKLAHETDLLNMLPRYCIWINGQCREEVTDNKAFSRKDLVFFLLWETSETNRWPASTVRESGLGPLRKAWKGIRSNFAKSHRPRLSRRS